MRVLIDVAHPAHVHFYRHMLTELSARGHEWRIVSRDKDVTNRLLDEFGLPYTTTGNAGPGFASLARELIARDATLLRIAREFRPDVILTRNPAGTHVGRLLRIPAIFDTDNGRSAGVHLWSAAPFATVITTPDCVPSDLGRKQLTYPSYKSLAFLHPNRFTPDEGVRQRLGVSRDEPYFLIRLVSMAASHDTGERGLDLDQVAHIIERLEGRGRVFLSSEFALPPNLSGYKLNTKVSDFHNVVASAALCVGDSGSVVQESALMGVPTVFISSFAGRTAPIEELEHRYGLIRSFHPSEFRGALEVIDCLLVAESMEFAARHRSMLAEKVDLTEWYLTLLDRLLSDPRRSGRRDARP